MPDGGFAHFFEALDGTAAPTRDANRADLRRAPRSLDDPSLRGLKIGLHFIGDDYANPPPAEALARRGIVANVVGYSLYGDYRQPNPPARLIEAVARREVDAAIAWRPLAGYFAPRQSVKLRVTPLVNPADGPPFEFAMAMGVRKGDTTLRDQLEQILRHRQRTIEHLLESFYVPLVKRG